MKTIVIYTLFYPRTDYDQYVSHEIKILAASFDRVIIVPMNASPDPIKEIPGNAIISDVGKSTAWKFALFVLRYAPTLLGGLFATLRQGNRGIIGNSRFFMRTLLEIHRFQAHYRQLEKTVAAGEHYVYSYWTLNNVTAIALLPRKNIRLICRFHSADLYLERAPVGYFPFRKLLAKKASLLAFISDQGKNYAEQHEPLLPQEKMIVNRIGIPDFMDGDFYASPDDKMTVISNSWLYRNKRIERIIEALAMLNAPRIEWIHFGKNYNDEGYEAELKSLAANILGPKGNISFVFRGEVPNSNILSFLKTNSADLFINVSESEGIPVSMMEAMCAGIPVIGTHVGGVSEIVHDGVNGYLLPPDPPAATIARMIAAYHALSPEAKTDMRRMARETWATSYNAGRNAAALVHEIRLPG